MSRDSLTWLDVADALRQQREILTPKSSGGFTVQALQREPCWRWHLESDLLVHGVWLGDEHERYAVVGVDVRPQQGADAQTWWPVAVWLPGPAVWAASITASSPFRSTPGALPLGEGAVRDALLGGELALAKHMIRGAA